MGLGGISIWQLLIVLAIIILIFGTKKFRNIGGDVGNAVKGFKKAMHDDEDGTPVNRGPEKITKDDADFTHHDAVKEQDKTSDKP